MKYTLRRAGHYHDVLGRAKTMAEAKTLARSLADAGRPDRERWDIGIFNSDGFSVATVSPSRIKSVWGSASACVHAWASRKYPRGTGGPVSFDGDTLRSYRAIIARFETVQSPTGPRLVCLVSRETFSSTTSQHIPYSRDLPPDILWVRVPYLSGYYGDRVQQTARDCFNVARVQRDAIIAEIMSATSYPSVLSKWDKLCRHLGEYGYLTLANIIGESLAIPEDSPVFAKVTEAEARRAKSLAERDTPANVAKREKAQARRAEQRERADQAERERREEQRAQWARDDAERRERERARAEILAEVSNLPTAERLAMAWGYVKAWESDGRFPGSTDNPATLVRVNYCRQYVLPYDFIRVSGDMIRTSRSAEAPVSAGFRNFARVQSMVGLLLQARSAFSSLTSFDLSDKHLSAGPWDITQLEVVEHTDRSQDVTLRVGCHTFLWSQVERVYNAWEESKDSGVNTPVQDGAR